MSTPDDTAPVAPVVWTIRQVAEALQVSEKTVWSLSRAGRLRPIHIGRAVRHDPADVRALIEAAKGGRP